MTVLCPLMGICEDDHRSRCTYSALVHNSIAGHSLAEGDAASRLQQLKICFVALFSGRGTAERSQVWQKGQRPPHGQPCMPAFYGYRVTTANSRWDVPRAEYVISASYLG